MDGLTYGTLQKVVDATHHQQLVFVFLYIHEGFVGVHHLLHVGTLQDEVREGSILVVVGIDLLHLFKRQVAFGVCCDEDTAREAAPLWDEEHPTFIAGTKFLYRLVYFQEMLMREGLIDGDIVVAPREMCCCTWLLTRSRTARNAVHMDVD